MAHVTLENVSTTSALYKRRPEVSIKVIFQSKRERGNEERARKERCLPMTPYSTAKQHDAN